MPLDDAGLASAPPEEAATLGRLSAHLLLHALCFQQAVACYLSTWLCRDEDAPAGRGIPELIVNKLSISQWAQTLSLVRLRLEAVPGNSQAAADDSHAGPSTNADHAALCLQTNRELHSILPDTFVLRVDTQHGQVPICARRII